MNHLMRKIDSCLCENKDADQLCSDCTDDLRLCSRCTDSTIPFLLIPKYQAFVSGWVSLVPECQFYFVVYGIVKCLMLYVHSQ